MHSKIVGNNSFVFSILYGLLWMASLVLPVMGLTYSVLNIDIFNGNHSFSALLVIVLITFFMLLEHFSKPKILTFLHEKIHEYKAKKYNYPVKIMVYHTLKERKELKRNGFCQFDEGIYEKISIRKIFIAPFMFYILMGIVFFISAIFISNFFLASLLYFLSFVCSIQLLGCKSDVKGYMDLLLFNKSSKTVLYKNDSFFI